MYQGYLNISYLSFLSFCSKFDFVTPPPGWSQQEMEAPFAIPAHLQGDAAELDASFMVMDPATFSFSLSAAAPPPLPPPPPPPPPPSPPLLIDLKAVTEYVSS